MGSGAIPWRFDVLAARLAGAALVPELWPDALGEICRSAGASGALLFSSDARFQNFPFTRNLGEAVGVYLRQGWHLRDERYRGVGALEARGFIDDDDCMSREERLRSPFYQDFLRRLGFGEFLGLGFRAGDDLWCLSLQRDLGQPAFDSYERSRLLTLWRPLADAATLARQFGAARAQGLIDGLEGARQAAAIFDGAGGLLALNGLAEARLGDGFGVTGRTLHFADPASQDRFAALLAQAVRQEPEPRARPLADVVRDRAGQPLPIRLLALRGFAQFSFANARALLLIGDADAAASPPLRFGLTTAEARLAGEIARGDSLAEIAERHHVTYGTTRSQLRAIFSKTQTHRQAELAALWSRLGRK